MLPAHFPGQISQRAQKAVLMHHGDRENLILGIDYQISGAQMPDHFAWVISVPNEPDDYQLADSAIFSQTRNWMAPLLKRWERPRIGFGCGCATLGMPDSTRPSLEFGEAAQVGPYSIQPVRGVGSDAVSALNGWLQENGFPSEDPKHLAYFVEEKFTFLCIRVDAPAGATAVAASAKLPPLQLSFRSERPYYPLLFSARQGVFDLDLMMLTEGRIDFDASADTLRKLAWSDALKRNVRIKSKEIPGALWQALSKSGEPPTRMYANRLICVGVNRGDSIFGWTEDVFLATGGRAKAQRRSGLPLLVTALALIWLRWRAKPARDALATRP